MYHQCVTNASGPSVGIGSPAPPHSGRTVGADEPAPTGSFHFVARRFSPNMQKGDCPLLHNVPFVNVPRQPGEVAGPVARDIDDIRDMDAVVCSEYYL